MPTFKKYSGIKACEDLVQRITISANNNADSTVRAYTDVNGVTSTSLNCGYSSTAGTVNRQYLRVNSISASADDYNPNDYNGTSTGSCSFNMSVQTGGVSYQIQFTANESATIKCFKFFKTLWGYPGNITHSYNTLMFAVYFDQPISVTSGQILNMSINFAYDEEQVTII